MGDEREQLLAELEDIGEQLRTQRAAIADLGRDLGRRLGEIDEELQQQRALTETCRRRWRRSCLELCSDYRHDSSGTDSTEDDLSPPPPHHRHGRRLRLRRQHSQARSRLDTCQRRVSALESRRASLREITQNLRLVHTQFEKLETWFLEATTRLSALQPAGERGGEDVVNTQRVRGCEGWHGRASVVPTSFQTRDRRPAQENPPPRRKGRLCCPIA